MQQMVVSAPGALYVSPENPCHQADLKLPPIFVTAVVRDNNLRFCSSVQTALYCAGCRCWGFSMNGSAGSKLAAIQLRDNYGFLIGGGGGRGPSTPQSQDGAGPVMKPDMGMLLTTAAGNNGLSHCSAFFPPCFSSQVCFHIIKKIGQKEDSMYRIHHHNFIFLCPWLHIAVYIYIRV